MEAGGFVHTFGDVHIYENHIEQMKEQMTRTPHPFPKVTIDSSLKSIDDLDFHHIILEGYEGLATVSTIDPQTAILQVLVIPEFIEDVDGILDHLKDQFKIQEMATGGQRALLC